MRQLGALAQEVEVDVLESCPWCSSTSISRMATRGDGLPVMRCSSCHLGFLGEVPIDLAVFYDEEYFKRSDAPGEQPAFAGYEDYNRSYSPSSFRWLAMLIRSIAGPDAKTIFDLGAATGTFLEAASIEGFEPYGAELNPIAAEQAVERGASVRAGPFNPSDWAGSRFDVVTALEVLEHVKDVRVTLSGLAELASRDGLIVFFVPNVDDHLVERYGDSALDFQKSYDHTLYFNPAFLHSMCEELFGPDSLTLLTHEAEEWGQTVSAALGFIRVETRLSRPEREFVEILNDGSEGQRISELSSYDALALALTAAKFSEDSLADIAMDRATAEGADPVQLSTAKAQIHRHRGELIKAVSELEHALVGKGLTGDPIGVAVLMDCLGDLAMLMGARGVDLASSMGELLERFDSVRSKQEALTRMEELLHSTITELRDTREERVLREREIRSELELLRGRNSELTGEVAKLSEARVHLQEEARAAVELRSENSRLRSQLNEIYQSRAWRLVSGVRSAKSLPRRLLSSSETTADSHLITTAQPPRMPLEALEALPFLVSVIMPVYNKGQTMRETIDSVLAQTMDDVEIVVWNDGSTDEDTLRTLDEVSQLPGVQVFHAENRGVVAARNSAMALARGRYFCCLDPDDIIDPTYLEKACAILQSGSGYAIAYPYVHSFGDVDERWETQDLDPALILKANHVPVCAVFDRRVFDLTGGFSDAMADGYEDWEFWVHAAELGFKGKAIPEHLFHYRYSRSQQESRDALARQRDSDLKERIRALHPHLARTGRPMDSVPVPDLSFGDLTMGQRKYPTGSGNPIVVTLPWFTIGGADTVVEMAVRRWVDAGRTVVVFTTHEVGAGMTNRIEDLRSITSYVYQLPAMLPEHLWDDFVDGIVSSLDSPTLWNVGSAWLYRHLSELRAKFPDLIVVDQQFNEIGHLDSNRKAAESIDLTVAAYAQLAEKLRSDGRTTSVKPIYVGIEDVGLPSATAVSKFREGLGVTEDEDLVLYVGRLSEEKRPEWMVELANRLRPAEAKVAVIGNGPHREAIAKAAGENPELIWIEETDSVMEAISAADVIALPSRTEGIPLVALEALAVGTPIVATAVGGLPDLKGIDGVTLTDPADFEDFLGGIRATLNGPSQNVTLPTEFRSESMLEQLDAVLFSLSRERAEELSG